MTSHRAFAWFLAAALAWSVPAGSTSPAGPTAGLSEELRTAFIAEMVHLEKSLQRVVSGVARADWPAVERAAAEMKGSFILEQQLKPEQRAELHRRLPDAFLAMDREFHEAAGRLAEAARGADAELAAFFTYRLTDACTSCHARYAEHRFPGFHSPSEPAHHH